MTNPHAGPDHLAVPVGPLTFDVTVAGPEDGMPVVLLHGFPQTAWSWRHVIPALAEAGYRVIAPDQRGYSPRASPDGVEAYAGEHLAADVLGVLDALGIARADLVGHDWGAAVAWQVAARHPERVRTLTVLSVPHPRAFLEALATDPDQKERSAYMKEFATPGHEHVLLADGAQGLRALFDAGLDGRSGPVDGVDVDHVVARLGTPQQLRHALDWYAAQTYDRAASTPSVEAPTLHLWSDRDWALGEVGTRATAQHVSGPYELVTLTGVSHWIPEQAPEQVVAHLLRHLANPRKSPAAAG